MTLRRPPAMTPRKTSRVTRHRIEPVETQFYALVNEEEALDLASGYVPLTVVAMMRTMLDWLEIDRRRAERPVKAAR